MHCNSELFRPQTTHHHTTTQHTTNNNKQQHSTLCMHDTNHANECWHLGLHTEKRGEERGERERMCVCVLQTVSLRQHQPNATLPPTQAVVHRTFEKMRAPLSLCTTITITITSPSHHTPQHTQHMSHHTTQHHTTQAAKRSTTHIPPTNPSLSVSAALKNFK